MAQVNDAPLIQRRKAGTRPVRKHSLKTDMTPMVDLGFLLIAFFVMTTEMNKPRVANLIMPKNGPPTDIKNSTALTVLLGKDNTVTYYHGDWTIAMKNDQVYQTTFSVANGVGKVIREKQQWLEEAKLDKEGKKALMLMIKPSKETPYSQVIEMLDETIINNVTRYAIVTPTEEEIEYLKTKQKP